MMMIEQRPWYNIIMTPTKTSFFFRHGNKLGRLLWIFDDDLFHNRHNWCSAFLAECDVEHDDLIIWIEDKTEKRERVHHSHRLQSQDRHYYRLLIHHLLSQCMIISAVFLSRSSSWVIVSSSLIVMVTFHTEYIGHCSQHGKKTNNDLPLSLSFSRQQCAKEFQKQYQAHRSSLKQTLCSTPTYLEHHVYIAQSCKALTRKHSKSPLDVPLPSPSLSIRQINLNTLTCAWGLMDWMIYALREVQQNKDSVRREGQSYATRESYYVYWTPWMILWVGSASHGTILWLPIFFLLQAQTLQSTCLLDSDDGDRK